MPPLQGDVCLVRTQPVLNVPESRACQLIDDVVHLLPVVQVDALPVPLLQVELVCVQWIPADVL